VSEDAAKPVSEVRPMQQKGSGLTTLKKSLEMFRNPGNIDLSEYVKESDATVEEDTELSHEERQQKRQRLLEANVLNAAIDRWRAEDAHLRSIGVNSGLSGSTIGAMMWKWHEKLVPTIKDDIRKSHEAEKKAKRSKDEDNYLQWGPYLQSLSPEKISAITILSAMKTSSTDGVDERGIRLHHVVQSIGDAVQNESIAEHIRKNRHRSDWKGLNNLARARSKHDNLTKLIQSSRSDVYEKLEWGQAMRIQLGAVLLAHLMDIAKVQMSRRDPATNRQVQEAQPVFFHTYQYISGKRVGVVRLNSAVWEKLAKTPVSSVLAKYLPMVAEPKPWVGYQEGGFLEHNLPVIRLTGSDLHSKRYAVTAAENGDMSQVFAGLDVLAKTQWKINRFVFDVMLQAWNTGEAIAKIPAEDPPADYPPEPSVSDDARERKRWMRKIREMENHRSGQRSTRCFQNFQLEVARAYLDETFYFPHNCDFRGRAYPMAPFLNHMGADNARGLLVFAQGKELTTEGLYWLKVHLANVYGFDKASFDKRIQFTNEHRAEIYDSVNNPLKGSRWWLNAEDPWQCLAACKEMKNALDLPDPTKYVCQLAIHQDGTCNGLQHYAALGGDIAGAQQVNLEPGVRPSDIYTAVAEIVKAGIATEAAQGKELAKALDGKVTRKVVKQTVMTNVYGVTFTGAKRQVRKQLDELVESFPETYDVNRALAAPYIARKIFQALATMFNGAHDIQYWLTDCAARISESLAPEQVDYIERDSKGEKPPNFFKTIQLKGNPKDELTSFKSTVIWTTPLKMPVVQPYRKKSSRRIETNLQKITIMNRSAADPVHKAKQLQAFPPNFIHSLDATHMFLTALKCNEVGLTFASIHDSFWTHAGDVNTMNCIIRDAFIRMHSEDIIGRLAAEFRARYKGYMQLASVRTDTPIGQQIMAWRRSDGSMTRPGGGKEFAKTIEARKRDELLMEHRRRDLLASEDPKKREEGEKMVTAGKLFEQARDEKALAPVGMKTSPTGGLGPSTTSSSSRATKLKANHQLDVGDLENAEAVLPVHEEDLAQASSEANEDEALATAEDSYLADDDAEADEVDDTHLVIRGIESLRVGEKNYVPEAKRKNVRKVWVWLPLTFPPVPKKGDFDVTRLKDSQYFFS
jgi:DNA-directed RNA polymerase